MRISADENDSGYIEAAERHKYYVELDGVRQKWVITADEEEGFVLRTQQDEGGSPAIEGDYFVDELVYGKVKIIKL